MSDAHKTTGGYPLPDGTPMGDWAEMEVSDRYDGCPVLFLAEGTDGRCYLAVFSGYADGTEYWWYAPLSQEGESALRKGDIDKYNAMARPDGGLLFLVLISEHETVGFYPVPSLMANTDSFPAKGCKLLREEKGCKNG